MTSINNSASFQRQTLAQLVSQGQAAFNANLPGANAGVRRSNLAISSIVMAAMNDAEFAYIDWIINNALMPDSAAQPYSSRWGAVKGATPNGPTPASGQASWTGGQPGTTIDPDVLWQLQPGVDYATTGTITFSAGGTCTGSIYAVNSDGSSPLAVTANGADWNCSAGATLTAVQAQAGVPGQATVVADIANGTPAETNAAFQARYLQLYKAPPQGGDFNDYVEWALEVPGVTRAWVSPLQKGAGTIVVYFMMDVARAADSGVPQGTTGVATAETRDTPATGDQLTVANYIYYERFLTKGSCRPVTALVYLFAPTLVSQPFTLKYVPASQQGAVAAAIAALLVQEGSAATVNTTTGSISGGTVNLADIQAAVRAVPQCSGALVLGDNIGTTIGQLPVLGDLFFLSANTGNVGNGAVSPVTPGAGLVSGTYSISFSSATAFTVTAPAGGTGGSGTVGTPYTTGGLGLTISAGGTAFASGDGFQISVIT